MSLGDFTGLKLRTTSLPENDSEMSLGDLVMVGKFKYDITKSHNYRAKEVIVNL